MSMVRTLEVAYTELMSKIVDGEFTGEVFYEGGYAKLKEGKYVLTLNFPDHELRLPEKAIVKVKGKVYLKWLHSGYAFPTIEVHSCEILSEGNREEDRVIQYVGELPSLCSYVWNTLQKKKRTGEKIKIMVIHGRNAQTHIDFKKAFYDELAGYDNKVDFSIKEVPLNDDKLSEFFTGLPDDHGVDLFCIVRGGGDMEELGRVGGPKTVKAIIDRKIKIALGLGHSLDMWASDLEKVAIGIVRPPAALGIEVAKIIKYFFEREETLEGFKFNANANQQEKEKVVVTYEDKITAWLYIYLLFEKLNKSQLVVHLLGKKGTKSFNEFRQYLTKILKANGCEERVVLYADEVPLDDEKLSAFLQEKHQKGHNVDLYCILQDNEGDPLEEIGGIKTILTIIDKRIRIALGLSKYFVPGFTSKLESVSLMTVRPPVRLAIEIGFAVCSYFKIKLQD